MARKLTSKAIDKQIETIYYRLAQGKEINIMDIGKVFKAGHSAIACGTDLETAVAAAVKMYCKPA